MYADRAQGGGRMPAGFGGMGFGGGFGMQAGFAGGGYGGPGFIQMPQLNPYSATYNLPPGAQQDPYGLGTVPRGWALGQEAEIQLRKARLLNQEVDRSKVDTRRKIYDEWLYERAGTPTLAEDHERSAMLERRRAAPGAPLSEVLSGRALNTALDDLTRNPGRNVKQGSAPIDPEVLRQINMTSRGGGGSVGVLRPVRAGAALNWPPALQDPAYQNEVGRLNQRAAEAVMLVWKTGQVDAGTLNDMRDDIRRLRSKVNDRINDLTPSQFIEANRFLNQLSDAVTALAQPDVADTFTDQLAARPRTVPDLVRFMAEKGLKFAPAVGGDEAAYSALYNSLIASAPPAAEPGRPDLVDAWVGLVAAGARTASPLYERPTYSRDDRLFDDLLAYAPGMNTARADVLAVLEAEGPATPEVAPGRIDPDARRLIDRARAAGWRKVTFPGRDGKPAFALVCDGGGRYAYEHTLPAGLVERVVCDGKTLLHLYPELGVGARRTVSRFHRAEFAALVPWALPPAEDLAAGADVTAAGERTVAVVPRAAAEPCVGLHLAFAADGRLAERRRVEVASDKVLGREVYDADGTVRLFDADGKEESVRRLTATAAAEPDLAPDRRQLVVLPLPLRTREQVIKAHAPQWAGQYDNLDPSFALALIAADRGDGNAEAREVIRQNFLNKGDRRPGFSTLWAATGQALDQLPLPEPQAAPALTRYLRWLKGRAASGPAGGPAGPGEGLFGRLAALDALARPWTRHDAGVLQGDEYTRLLEFVRAGRSPALTWALTSLVLEDRTRHTVLPGGMAAVKRRVLDEACRSLDGVPDLGYVARYEQARLCWEAGDRARARELFREAYRLCLEGGELPPIDGSFRQALREDGGDAGAWTALLRETARRLREEGQPFAVLALARQCALLDDPRLAGELIDDVLARAAGEPQRLPVSVAALQDLWDSHQYERADRLLRALLADDAFAGRASLWRLAAKFAAERHQAERHAECLGRALELEYQHLPEVIDLAGVRRDYGELLAYYERLAGALATLHQPPPRDFLVRVVSAADRWRALDVDGTAACQSTARIFKALGQDDLAWDYLTTPLGGRPGDPQAALQLARALAGEGQRELAERAYRVAGAADPSNAQVVWERAANLEELGRAGEGRQVLRELADGTWPEQYQELQRQARSRLGEKQILTK
jgi:hypothetical protein